MKLKLYAAGDNCHICGYKREKVQNCNCNGCFEKCQLDLGVLLNA